MNADVLPGDSGTRRRWRVCLALLVAGLAVCMLPGVTQVAEAKKKKRNAVRVMSYNLYLGADLAPAVEAISTAPPGDPLSQFDLFADQVGRVLQKVEVNNFPRRAKRIAKDIRKRKTDLVGLQEAALFRLQIPTDGGAPSARNPTAQLATVPLVDYIDTLLQELNRKARSKKQCASAKKKAKAAGKKPKPCYRGYRLVVAQQEADVEFPGDFDHNPGPDGIHGNGPGKPPTFPGPLDPTYPRQGGVDDTGVFFGDPDGNDGDANLDGNNQDCPDQDPAAPDPPVGFFDLDASIRHVCLFHGIDGDARLTMRDAILARKGPGGPKTRKARRANYANTFTVPAPGGATVRFLRGWTSVEANVRGKKFRFVNTHLESESEGSIREDQAAELVAPGGIATKVPTVLVGDLNSDPNRPPTGLPDNDGGSNIAINRLFAAGFRSLSGPGMTGGHGEFLIDRTNILDNGRIDHILTNSPKIGVFGRRVIDPYVRGLWSSDHGGVFAALKVPGKKKKR